MSKSKELQTLHILSDTLNGKKNLTAGKVLEIIFKVLEEEKIPPMKFSFAIRPMGDEILFLINHHGKNVWSFLMTKPQSVSSTSETEVEDAPTA